MCNEYAGCTFALRCIHSRLLANSSGFFLAPLFCTFCSGVVSVIAYHRLSSDFHQLPPVILHALQLWTDDPDAEPPDLRRREQGSPQNQAHRIRRPKVRRLKITRVVHGIGDQQPTGRDSCVLTRPSSSKSSVPTAECSNRFQWVAIKGQPVDP